MSRSIPFVVALMALTAGCVATPDAQSAAPQCEVSADCDQGTGEICDEGICWGGPPTSTFAAVLAPPEDRTDLALTEIPVVPIAADGTIDVLQFGESLVVSGRVTLACIGEDEPLGCGPDESIAARVTFERDSRIPGGPRFKRTVQAVAGAADDDEAAFSVRLPTLSVDERYLVTIVPEAVEAVEGESVDPAAVAPPARFTLDPESETEALELTVGSPNALKAITGLVRTEFSEGMGGMQVFARGRWDEEGPVVRASNIVTTTSDGQFKLWVPIAMEDYFDVVARPVEDVLSPTLERRGLDVPDPVGPASLAPPLELDDLVTPPAPNPAPFVVTVVGTDPSGEEIRVSGADVTVTTLIVPSNEDATSLATYSASGTTSDEGTVELMLYPGGTADPRLYDVQVLPPPDSLSATLFSRTVEVAGVPPTGRGFLQKVVLDPRIPVSGSVVDFDGAAMTETSVGIGATRLFRNGLAPEEQGILDKLAYPSALTNSDGGFVVWVDPLVGSVPAIYDVELTPPADADAPRWSEEAIEVAQTSAGPISLGTVRLPPASWARGLVSAMGTPVIGAEVRIYEIDSNLGLCEQLAVPAMQDCEPTARLRGIWLSREDGWVWVVLPNVDEL